VDSASALTGLKVIELGTMVTAPLAAMLLAQLGAEVIKVEAPAEGDPFRRTRGDTYGPNFVAYNQNKKSVLLDLKTEGGREQFLCLLAQSDVLIENFRAGVMDRLGLSQAEMAKHNPNLIHCSITGFGADGPYSNRPAYDTVGTALAGILHLYLDREKPQVLGPTLADNVTGLFACIGVLAAVHSRKAKGHGQRVEVNMLESSIALIPDAFAYHTRMEIGQGPLSRASSSQCFAFRCSDGRAIAVHLSVQEKFWSAFLDAIDARDTLGKDERFLTRKSRLENYVALSSALAEIISADTSEFWSEAFLSSDVPFAPVNTIGEVLDDPQVKHLATFGAAEHPLHGHVTGIRSPIRINGSRNDVVAPPALGEHSEAILRALASSPKAHDEQSDVLVGDIKR
jgi:crotonobetainyl-CoA:carnitine CoA-transferase CaiB-like acyl-CoA transferase